ncbi:hypothetical protein HDU92_007517 [Lobulomyces angularis]|nr:hypothetical protein HDU92_007517 [Lobulomyces angularis]
MLPNLLRSNFSRVGSNSFSSSLNNLIHDQLRTRNFSFTSKALFTPLKTVLGKFSLATSFAKGSFVFASLFSIVGSSQQLLLAKKLETTIIEAQADGIITEEEKLEIARETFDLASTLPFVSSVNSLINHFDFHSKDDSNQLLEGFGTNVIEHSNEETKHYVKGIGNFVVSVYEQLKR